MKVAILGPVFTKTYFGGVATFDENLAIGFKKLGHDVDLISNQKDSPKYTNGNISIKTINSVQKKKYDLAIASLSYIRYLPRLNAAKKIYYLHGFFSFNVHGIIKTVLANIFQKYYINKVNYVISNSFFTHYVNRYLYGINSVGYATPGVSYEFLESIKSDEKIYRQKRSILYVGRITKQKNVEQIIKCLEILNKDGSNYSLTIIGDGKAKKQLMNYVELNNINVTFVEKKSQKDLANYYLANEFFASMHPTETFGLTYYEALLSGCKIICPKSGGHRDVLEHFPNEVTMIENIDPMSIANAVKKLSVNNRKDIINPNDFDYTKTASKIITIASGF